MLDIFADMSIPSTYLLTPTAYFPPLAWYVAAARRGRWLLEAHENYQKGGFRNRARIATANGPRWLSVPLEKGKNEAQPIGAVRVATNQNWVREHQQSIRSAYGRAPYYEFYADELFELMDELFSPNRLADDGSLLLRQSNRRLMDWLHARIAPPVLPEPTTAFVPPHDVTTGLDLRGRKSPMPEPPPPYPQLFADRFGFNGELSILDLLFCQGPAAGAYLRATQNR